MPLYLLLESHIGKIRCFGTKLGNLTAYSRNIAVTETGPSYQTMDLMIHASIPEGLHLNKKGISKLFSTFPDHIDAHN